MKKKELRHIYIEKRKAISDRDKMIRDDLLLIQFQQFNLDQINTVLSYWPIENHKEPNTHLITRYLGFMVPQMRIAYPRTDFKTLEMQAILVNEETNYQETAAGIIEPYDGCAMDPQELDLVLVPLLVCDKSGNRVGYGKGFYDRFLTKCRNDVVLLGFSYEDPIDKIEDASAFDIPLNFCITPDQIYEFEY